MAARKAARLYYSFDDTDPVKEHLKALISPSPIEKLILMCNDINCMTGKFEELDGTVEPDPKSNSELQQKRATILLRANAANKMELWLRFRKEGFIVPILYTWNRILLSDESSSYNQNT